MQGIDNLSIRLNSIGGSQQQKRMNEDKLRTLKKALWYSYQGATAELADGRQFRCLINPEKIKNSYDNKYISIPFEDVCLNNEVVTEPERAKLKKENVETIGMKPGDVFTGVENGTDWLVYLRRLEETAYFRAEIRRCKYTININENEYKCYFARNSVDNIDWRRQKDNIGNDLDYNATMYITKNAETEAFFHRFAIVKINNKPGEVQAIDDISSDGIIIIALKEGYNNEFAETVNTEPQNENEDLQNENPHIVGKEEVYPYDKLTYTIENVEQGIGDIDSQKVKILNESSDSITIEIITGRSGNFTIKYITADKEINLPVKILSL